MKIYDFSDYRGFIQSQAEQAGRGAYGKLARAIKVHSTLISQVVRGLKPLSLEQGLGIARYYGLGERETQYWLLLIQIDRAGTEDLKAFYRKQAEALGEQAQHLVNRLPQDTVLSEPDRAIFYSNWYYSGVRLTSSIPGRQTPDSIATALGLPLSLVTRVLEFLVARGLCVEDDGRYRMGPARTHIEAGSPLVSRHHSNWRLKAMERFESISPEEIVFTSPLTLSAKDLPVIRAKALEFIDASMAVADASGSDTLACLNIDWVKL